MMATRLTVRDSILSVDRNWERLETFAMLTVQIGVCVTTPQVPATASMDITGWIALLRMSGRFIREIRTSSRYRAGHCDILHLPRILVVHMLYFLL
mmetsp:Transcript_9436/g.14220  ORF Transcript_9436/g.14220 Transcript_9436/m.14220 type:complete len:96 (+) Transcript_9436:743-1030(+)